MSPAKGLKMFKGCTSIEEVINQAVSAGAMCWSGDIWGRTFDLDKAVEVANAANARVRELQGKRD